MEWTSIAWRKRNDGIDFYQTPTWVTQKILEREPLNGTTLEPCCGAWAISKLIPWIVSQDIRTDDGVFGDKWVDFFQETKHYDNIITNPPYFCAKDFILKAIELSDGKVIMLLKLSFLESADRYEFFRNTPLKTVYVFCKRVNMYPEWIEVPKNSWTIAYAWYVWEKWYTGKPIIEWIL